jgi:methionyl-tRNA synthetase
MTTTFNPDHFLADFHQRRIRGVAGYCENCEAGLTDVDVENNECTACRSQIVSDDEDLQLGEQRG